jgi:hypothetical protein
MPDATPAALALSPEAGAVSLQVPASGYWRRGGRCASEVLAQPLKERMPHLGLGRFGAVLDLGQQLGLDPERLMRDRFAVGLGLADQRRQAPAQLGGRGLVEAPA